MVTKGEFKLGRIAYLLKNNFTSISTSTSTTETLTLTLLAINPIPQPTLPIQPTLSA